MLSYGSTGTTAASDAHPASYPLPGATGYRTPRSGDNTAGHRAGEGLPSSRRHHRHVPRPIRRGVPHGCASRLFAASMAFAPISRGSALPYPPATGQLSNDAAGFASCYGPHRRSPRKGFRRWAPAPPVSRRHRQPATGPPGSYPDRTSTGRRRRAYEHEDTPWLTSRRHLRFCWAHEKGSLTARR